jgi:RNA polymerase sigma-70 factor (ECF subfamily)
MSQTHPHSKQAWPAQSEAELVAKVRYGDADAFTELVRAYSPKLRSAAWRVVRNWADAEDVVQIALWKAYRHLPGFEERAALSTWLTCIAVNEGLGLLRKRKVEPVDLAGTNSPPKEVRWPIARAQTPEQLAVSSQFEWTVRQCIKGIHPTYQAALRFRFLDDLSHDEIAQRLGLPLGTVKTRLHRGCLALRGMLQRRGIVSSGRPIPERIAGVAPTVPALEELGKQPREKRKGHYEN